jgi:hypothetical protein
MCHSIQRPGTSIRPPEAAGTFKTVFNRGGKIVETKKNREQVIAEPDKKKPN